MTIKLDKEILINLDTQTIKSAIKDLDFCIEMIRENLVSDIEIYQELKNLFPGKVIIEDSCKSLFSKDFENKSFLDWLINNL